MKVGRYQPVGYSHWANGDVTIFNAERENLKHMSVAITVDPQYLKDDYTEVLYKVNANVVFDMATYFYQLGWADARANDLVDWEKDDERA